MTRPAARQMSFADLELLWQGVRLEPLLQAICDFLDRQPALVERVRRDLMRGLKQPDHGRRGLTAPQVLRALVLMRVKNWDYRELRERIADGITLRAFTNFYCEEVPKHDAFNRSFNRLTPATLKAINELVVEAAVKLGHHVAGPRRDNILNPARFDYVHASDTCIQCHSQGQPLTNPIQGKYYDWPVGYEVGKNLVDYWKLEEHKVGTLTFTHFPDGLAHKNRMQGNDFVESLMYARGVTCFSCHDPHGSDNVAMVRKPGNALCLDCHGPNAQAGPHAPTIEQHTHHKAGSAGNECIACHMPKIEQTIADQNVRSHTFRFVTPGDTDSLKIPNACNACHTDKSTEWATAALKSWPDRSPWRVAK
jgi:predicted CXXCH cytochrome family protein